jgi:hypothetical protein
MNNLLSYFGLLDAKIRASDKDLPVQYSQRASREETRESSSIKGHMMSECIYEIIDFPKYQRKNLIDVCPR